MEIFILWVFFSIVAGVIATQKGRSGIGFFFLSVILSPLIGVIAALVARPNVTKVEQADIQSGLSKKCAFCAEIIKQEATVCRYCGRELASSGSADEVSTYPLFTTYMCPACHSFQPSEVATCVKCSAPNPHKVGQGLQAVETDDFEERWAKLTKYDDAARAAVGSLQAYGTPAIAELKKAYRVVGDRSQLPRIAEQIAREVEESRDPAKLMAKFGITKEANQYVYRGYRYDKLEDAVNYAKRQNP